MVMRLKAFGLSLSKFLEKCFFISIVPNLSGSLV